ncbi:porin family protein [Chryseobacterium sp.]|uniref:porin family protein n=1 Tax=Chryseobacterium sp. TaxID=1871047 RepID=UPI0011C7AE86|nr:porin family protein [Chryseobacterium sp.]TXF79082.1 PorT family protein [Chryseobacterium sp.]
MKNLWIAASLLFCTAASAQTTYGLKAGYASSSFASDEMSEFEGIDMNLKSRSGYYVGGFVEHKLNEKFALQADVQYASLGGKMTGGYDDGTLNFTLDTDIAVNQILIPVSAKYYVTPSFSLSAGPFVGFRTSTKVEMSIKDTNIPAEFISEIEGEFTALENEMEKSLEENMKSTNFGVHVGGQYTFYKGLFAEARYNIGLSNLEESSASDSKTTMSYLQIGLGYTF